MNGQDYIDRVLDLDFRAFYVFVMGVLRDPTSNMTVFALLLGAITILVLLIILVLVVLITGGEEDYVEVEVGPDGVTPAAVEAELAPVEEPEPAVVRTPWPKWVTALVWVAAFALVWMVGGYVSGRDTVCISCHVNSSIHVVRDQQPEADPHSSVKCVLCHETSNQLASVTTAVPARAAHYVFGVAAERLAKDYGFPIANRTCARCHEESLSVITENPDRGLRMSHAEPLAAKALCSDCHAVQPGVGVVDRYIVGMDPCLRCHDQEIASAECATCHTKDISYAVRSRTVTKPKAQIVDISCGGCHSQKACDACHGIRMPHTQEFIGAMHARQAVEDIWDNDGRVCKRCHSATRRPCTKCHVGTFPTHPPGYMPKGHQSADPYNNGCDQCHDTNAWMVGRNFCGLCHERYNSVDPERTTRTP